MQVGLFTFLVCLEYVLLLFISVIINLIISRNWLLVFMFYIFSRLLCWFEVGLNFEYVFLTILTEGKTEVEAYLDLSCDSLR